LLLFSKGASDKSETASTATTEPLFGIQFPDEKESWLQPGEERQLKRNHHIALTVLLWSITLFLALEASSLGDVLNLTGCACGTGTFFCYKLSLLFMQACLFIPFLTSCLYSYFVHSSSTFFI
jgi:hypothetical protein